MMDCNGGGQRPGNAKMAVIGRDYLAQHSVDEWDESVRGASSRPGTNEVSIMASMIPRMQPTKAALGISTKILPG